MHSLDKIAPRPPGKGIAFIFTYNDSASARPPLDIPMGSTVTLRSAKDNKVSVIATVEQAVASFYIGVIDKFDGTIADKHDGMSVGDRIRFKSRYVELCTK